MIAEESGFKNLATHSAVKAAVKDSSLCSRSSQEGARGGGREGESQEKKGQNAGLKVSLVRNLLLMEINILILAIVIYRTCVTEGLS